MTDNGSPTPNAAPAPSPSSPSSPGTSTPNVAPTASRPNSGQRTQAQPSGGKLESRLQQAADGPAQVRTSEPITVKHRLPDGTEVDVDITSHVNERLQAASRRKVKIDKTEREITVDEAFEKYPLAESARARYEESAKLRREAETVQAQVTKLGQMLRDPEQLAVILSRPEFLGPDGLQRFAEGFIMRQLEIERMTPAERANHDKHQQIEAMAREREAKLAAREAKLAAQEKQALEAETKAVVDRYTKLIPQLLQSADIPANKETITAFVNAKLEYKRLGMPVTDAQIAKEVAEQYTQNIRAVASQMSPERLSALLGENTDKIRQAAVAQVADQPGRKVSVKGAKPTASDGIPDWVKTPNQYRDWVASQGPAASARRKVR